MEKIKLSHPTERKLFTTIKKQFFIFKILTCMKAFFKFFGLTRNAHNKIINLRLLS